MAKSQKNGVQTIRYDHEAAEKCPDARRVGAIFSSLYHAQSHFSAAMWRIGQAWICVNKLTP